MLGWEGLLKGQTSLSINPWASCNGFWSILPGIVSHSQFYRNSERYKTGEFGSSLGTPSLYILWEPQASPNSLGLELSLSLHFWCVPFKN